MTTALKHALDRIENLFDDDNYLITVYDSPLSSISVTKDGFELFYADDNSSWKFSFDEVQDALKLYKREKIEFSNTIGGGE
jgi:hypothetical protein